MANSTIKENAISRLINTQLHYDATNKCFPIPTGTRKPHDSTTTFQLTLAARNNSTGALYIIWYDWTKASFKIGSIISGNAPTEGQAIDVSYLSGGVKRYLCELLAGVWHDECDKKRNMVWSGELHRDKQIFNIPISNTGSKMLFLARNKRAVIFVCYKCDNSRSEEPNHRGGSYYNSERKLQFYGGSLSLVHYPESFRHSLTRLGVVA